MQVDGCQLRYERLSDLHDACALTPTSWLTDDELSELGRLKDDRRRRSWLAGRWLAKQSIDESLPAKSISILSRNKAGQADRPRVTIDGDDYSHSLSISHTDLGLIIAIAESADLEIGVDLAEEKLATSGFLTTWFTPAERETLHKCPESEVTVFWAIKEAVYKACQRGESFKPRKFEVSRCREGGYVCHYELWNEIAPCITVNQIDGQIAVIVMANRPRLGQQTETKEEFAAFVL